MLKKYLLTGGLAAVLMLGACGNDVPEASEEVETEESTDQGENESSDDNSEAVAKLQAENDSLQNRIAELEEENEDAESLHDRIKELEEENEQLEEMAANDTEEEDSAEGENNETASTGEGTRSDPMQLGSTAQLDVMINGDDYDDRYEASAELTISEIVIGEEAYDMLIAENQFNDPAPEGYQWALINSSIELVDSETEDYAYYVMDHFEIVEGDGSAAPRESAVTPDEYGSEYIYSGGTSTGYSSVLVPEDNEFLIKYDGFSSNTVFFEVD